MFDVRTVQNWINTTEPAEVERTLWSLRMYAHEHCEGFTELSAQTVKMSKAERDKEMREATTLGRKLAREGRIQRTATEIAEATAA